MQGCLKLKLWLKKSVWLSLKKKKLQKTKHPKVVSTQFLNQKQTNSACSIKCLNKIIVIKNAGLFKTQTMVKQ